MVVVGVDLMGEGGGGRGWWGYKGEEEEEFRHGGVGLIVGETFAGRLDI